MTYGYFAPERHGPFPLVDVHLSVEGFRRTWQGTVPFVLDTGAKVTCLRPQDAMEYLRIPAGDLDDDAIWHKAVSISGPGGSVPHWPARTRFEFVHKDRPPTVLTTDLHIGRLRESERHAPSVLGWDLLSHFQIVIIARSGARHGVVRLIPLG